MKSIISLIYLLCIATVLGAQDFEWVKTWGGIYNDWGNKLVRDAGGNIYVAGTFTDVVDFDPGPGTFFMSAPTAFSNYDLYVAKFDPDGNFIWARSFESTSTPSSSHEVRELLVDPSGNIFLFGEYTNTIDFDPEAGVFNMSTGSGSDSNGYILKLSSSGSLVWAKQIEGSYDSDCTDASFDSAGNIIISGNFNNTTDFDPGLGTSFLTPVGSKDVFILKLNSSGDFVWVKNVGGSSNDSAHKLVVDAAGNNFLFGRFLGTVDFNPGPGTFNLTSASAADLFLLKLDLNGNFVWADQYAESNSEVSDAQIDNHGNIFFSGIFSAATDLDPTTGIDIRTPIGSWDLFLTKIDTSGNLYWIKTMGGPLSEYIYEIALSDSGNIFLTGNFNDTADFDPGPAVLNLFSKGLADGFIQKMDGDGNNIWVKSFGGLDSEGGYSIYVDNLENIYVSGYFRDTTDFDPGSSVVDCLATGPTVWNGDVFLLKWGQDSCSNLTLIVDSVSSVTCLLNGYASSYTLHGLPPYDYVWNTTPLINDSIATFLNEGVFSINVTDANGCTRETSVLINAPITHTGFDLKANLVPGVFQPSVGSHIWLDAFNDGCDTVSGNLKLILDSLVSYNSSIPIPDLISGDTLIWMFSSITFDSAHLVPQVNVTTSTSASIGDTVCFTVIISPIPGDADSSNNIKTYCFPVLSSYDPNEKQVYPQGECTPKYVLNGEKLTYTIRFQNTGTADAINIYLLDTLDPNLDLNSVRVIGQSDYVITEVLPDHVLKFRFDNINLPDSTSDELNSHGYVIYEVDALPSVPNNTEINNTAHIFFDFNPPVATNTVFSTLVDSLPHYSTTQNINLLCGSNYTFADGTTITGITANTSHTSYLSAMVSCDSIITTNITVNPIDVSVTPGGSGATFMANATGVNYQWVDCSAGYAPISGETNQTFTTGFEGVFAVILTNGSCSDTSLCYTIGGIANLDNKNAISIYPNPTNSSITISTSNIAEKIYLKDIFGRTIKTLQPNSTKMNLDMHELESGIYFVGVVNNGIEQTVKILKE